MNMDKAPADSATFGYTGGGDAGRGRVEHRNFRHVEGTQSVRNSLSRYTGQSHIIARGVWCIRAFLNLLGCVFHP
jgi:hypothetical protein